MSDIHRRPVLRSGMLPFRSRKLEFSEPEVRKSGARSRKRENETPAEAYVSPRKKTPTAQLPEKYALLESFYEGIEAAISLLGIRRQLCTFQAVCATVEATTKRRFLQKHLAQVKYILPEAIELEYVRSYDQDTRSKRWEMKISLLPMPAEAEELGCDAGSSRKKPKIETVQRRRAFHARLLKFAATHPEHDDVPEHPLPERAFSGSSAIKTCIPMEINVAAHRVEAVPDVDSSLATHFPRSFKSSFSAEKPAVKPAVAATAESGFVDTILPMAINRTPHRDVHAAASEENMPPGTPHFAPSFSPFFSVKRSSTIVDDMPSPSVPLTPMKRQHAGHEEVAELLQTPIKATITASPSKRQAHFASPTFKPHFSSPVKPSVSKDVSISWDVRTPGRNVEEECAGMKTPVKSSSKPPKQQEFMPCTPGGPQTPVNVSYHAGEVCEDPGLTSPAATPVKPASSSRSLNFATPNKSAAACPCSPGMDVPSTPGVRTPSRFMKHSKLNLGRLFDDETSPSLRKSLSFASQSDMSLIQGLPAELVQSVMKEEMKVAEEKSKDVVGLRRRQQMMAGLPHLFNQLRLIFQSSNKSVFPYRELLSKVVSSNTEMTDRSEVEERLRMLMDLAPEWLSAKKSLSGDMLYRIDKKADVMSIRKRLCEASV